MARRTSIFDLTILQAGTATSDWALDPVSWNAPPAGLPPIAAAPAARPAFSPKGDYQWVGGNGVFTDGGNWINVQNETKGHVPGASNLAAIVTSATISGNGSVGELNIEDSGTVVDFTGAIKARLLDMEDGASLEVSSATGSLTVTSTFTLDGGSLTAADGASIEAVGFGGGATLSVTGGSKVTCSGEIGGDIVIVEGAGTVVTTKGFVATTLTLTDDARIVDTSTTAGDDIEGGSISISDGASFTTGAELTLGTALVSTGAKVTTRNDLLAFVSGTVLTIESGAKLSAAAATFGNDTVIVTGKGTSVSVKGAANFGDFATTKFIIEGGGRFQAGLVAMDEDGSVQNTLEVVGPGSSAAITGNLAVGLDGNGAVLVEGKGSAQAGSLLAGDTNIAKGPASVGSISVTGTGSTLLVRGYASLGVTGTAKLTVSAGGAFTVDGLFEAGVQKGSVGTAVITGAHSSLKYKGTLAVGGAGDGAFEIEAGGLVATAPGGTGAVEIAALAGGSGSVTVSGTGSALDGTTLAVGGTVSRAGGAGRLAIDTGGRVAVKTVEIWGHGAASLGGGSLTARSVEIKAGGALTGDGTVTAAVVNAGTIEASDGTLDLKGAVSGTGGTLEIGTGGTLELAGAVAATQKVTFAAEGTLDFADPAGFKAAIAGFAKGGGIDIAGYATAKASFKENAKKTEGTLTITDGAKHLSLVLLGQFAAAGFKVATDHQGGSLVTYAPPASPTALLALAGH